jgi:hypothetical protein
MGKNTDQLATAYPQFTPSEIQSFYQQFQNSDYDKSRNLILIRNGSFGRFGCFVYQIW